MSGRRPRGFHGGDRAEYLAKYVLSTFAQVVPVPRQEDYGVDLLCALTTRDSKSLFVEDTFGVQVKKRAKNGIDITYGGHNKKGEWKKYEIEWLLFGPSHPLLIGLVDIRQCRVDLYSTSNMWYVRWMAGYPFKVKLRSGMSGDQLVDPKAALDPSAESAQGDHGDCKIWDVPLGPPIISLSAADYLDDTTINQIYSTFKTWLSLDRRNVTYQKLDIPFRERFKSWSLNKEPQQQEHEARMFGNPGQGMNVADILRTISPMICALEYNFELQQNKDKVYLNGILDLLEKYNLRYKPAKL